MTFYILSYERRKLWFHFLKLHLCTKSWLEITTILKHFYELTGLGKPLSAMSIPCTKSNLISKNTHPSIKGEKKKRNMTKTRTSGNYPLKMNHLYEELGDPYHVKH